MMKFYIFFLITALKIELMENLEHIHLGGKYWLSLSIE